MRSSYPILQYNEFDYSSVKKKFGKVLEYLQTGNFRSAEVKKMQNTGYYRAKLDSENRLLFKFVAFEGQTYLLLVDLILNHDYDKCRFLRGAEINEKQLTDMFEASAVPKSDVEELRFVNMQKPSVHFLEKFISFDDAQSEILYLPVPMIIIGSAGSGKTALTLERLKMLKGNVAYVSLSSFLVENAEQLYYANGYSNNHQEVDFMSFKDYLQSIQIPSGRELVFKDFEYFYNKYKGITKIKETYKLFEEFKGVITGASVNAAYLSREEYMNLGVKQSVFTKDQRGEVYDLFDKYRGYLTTEQLYDTNLVSFGHIAMAKPIYDYVVVDEVQDLTNVQLQVILKSLKNPVGFVLCGDANQIVHPNFFSWSSLKSMFYKSELQSDIVRILHTNYRNSQQVTNLANTLLKIKNARFGSIDKESTHLIKSVASNDGVVEFLEDKDKLKQDLNQRTQNSTKFAVLVLSNADKAEARKFFNTPLVFSIHEAKGLEYENIILVNFISTYEKEFRAITEGISKEDLEADLTFGRNRDKENKELETYKFYINSLYVAITRAVQNLYLIEKKGKYPILQLLGLVEVKEQTSVKAIQSSIDDWKKEARKLEQQGKKEQSDAIRKMVAQRENRTHLSPEELDTLKADALNPEHFNNQAKKKLLSYCITTNDWKTVQKLQELKSPDARKALEKLDKDFNTITKDCMADKLNKENPLIKIYGVNFSNSKGESVLLLVGRYGALKSIKFLMDNGVERNELFNHQTVLERLLSVYVRERILLKVHNANSTAPYVARGNFNLGRFPKVYEILKTPSVQVKVDNRILKIGSHSMEYFMLHFMRALYEDSISLKRKNIHYVYEKKLKENADSDIAKKWLSLTIKELELGFSINDFMIYISNVPNSILPEYRRKRQYVNAIIAKNEIGSSDPYNKMLFKRTARGIYLLNPDLEVVFS